MYILQRILIGSVFSNFIIIFNVEILFSISRKRDCKCTFELGVHQFEIFLYWNRWILVTAEEKNFDWIWFL